MRCKAPSLTKTPASNSNWGGHRIGTRSTTVLAIAKPRRPVSLAQAPAICAQLARLVASNPKPEYSPAEIQACIGPVAHQVRGMVFAVLNWRSRLVRHSRRVVRIWAAPRNPEGDVMATDNPDLNAALTLATADRLKIKNFELIEIWLDAAGAALRGPVKAGRDLNRTGELLLSAGQWLTEERKRLVDEERLRQVRLRSAGLEARLTR